MRNDIEVMLFVFSSAAISGQQRLLSGLRALGFHGLTASSGLAATVRPVIAMAPVGVIRIWKNLNRGAGTD